MIQNILITGGAGYIGSHTTEIFIKNKNFITTSHIDERSAAFFALGLSKKTGRIFV